MQSFGQVIPVLGPMVGFPGQWSRTDDTIIEARVVLPTSTNPLYFGSGAVLIQSATTGGSWQSLADFLATATNAQYLQQYFAGIACRNVKVMQPYSALSQLAPAVIATTATQGTIGSTTIVVASASGLAIGQSVEGFGIQPTTTVTGISSTTITISLPTTGVLSTTNVVFTTGSTAAIGSYIQGTMGEVLVRSAITVAVTAGTPSAGAPVYVRTVANASTPGTSVGDFEAAAEVAVSGRTFGSTT